MFCLKKNFLSCIGIFFYIFCPSRLRELRGQSRGRNRPEGPVESGRGDRPRMTFIGCSYETEAPPPSPVLGGDGTYGPPSLAVPFYDSGRTGVPLLAGFAAGEGRCFNSPLRSGPPPHPRPLYLPPLARCVCIDPIVNLSVLLCLCVRRPICRPPSPGLRAQGSSVHGVPRARRHYRV